MFLQTEEELADFPERAIANLRYRKVTYNGKKYSWEGAYQAWEGQKYNENFNLFYSSMSDLLVFRVYCFSTYVDDPVDEAVLVRNVIVHLNQWLMKSTPLPANYFDKREIGRIVYNSFPNIAFRLFEYMWDCEVDMDFTNSRT